MSIAIINFIWAGSMDEKHQTAAFLGPIDLVLNGQKRLDSKEEDQQQFIFWYENDGCPNIKDWFLRYAETILNTEDEEMKNNKLKYLNDRIKFCPIDALLMKLTLSEKDAHLMHDYLNEFTEKNLGNARKELYSLALMALNGGYYFDTTIYYNPENTQYKRVFSDLGKPYCSIMCQHVRFDGLDSYVPRRADVFAYYSPVPSSSSDNVFNTALRLMLDQYALLKILNSRLMVPEFQKKFIETYKKDTVWGLVSALLADIVPDDINILFQENRIKILETFFVCISNFFIAETKNKLKLPSGTIWFNAMKSYSEENELISCLPKEVPLGPALGNMFVIPVETSFHLIIKNAYHPGGSTLREDPNYLSKVGLFNCNGRDSRGDFITLPLMKIFGSTGWVDKTKALSGTPLPQSDHGGSSNREKVIKQVLQSCSQRDDIWKGTSVVSESRFFAPQRVVNAQSDESGSNVMNHPTH